jgi:hypothetical protein
LFVNKQAKACSTVRKPFAAKLLCGAGFHAAGGFELFATGLLAAQRRRGVSVQHQQQIGQSVTDQFNIPAKARQCLANFNFPATDWKIGVASPPSLS